MAFILGVHIILVPFGVAFTFLMLMANYRGLRRHDGTALLLAERWSRAAAVLFAVGATVVAWGRGGAVPVPAGYARGDRHGRCPDSSLVALMVIVAAAILLVGPSFAVPYALQQRQLRS
jgi:hypothetical protein